MKYKLALSLLLLGMIGCGGVPSPTPVGNRAGLWKIVHSNSMPDVLGKSDGALGQFDFPVNIGFVGYVLTDYVGPRPSTITLVFRVNGNGVFDSNYSGSNGPAQGCFNPPSVTMVAQVLGDDLTQQDGRWWSGTTYLPQDQGAGDITVTMPVAPENWSNVEGLYGSTRPTQFEDSMKNLGHVGFTFGGGCNYGHGVNLDSGSSTFTLISYTVK